MNKLTILRYLPVLLLLVFACDDGFDELNTNVVDPTADDVDPVFQLNEAVINMSFPNSVLVYDMGIIQQIITPNSGVLTGANFNQDNRNSTEQIWRNYYRGVVRHTRDIISRISDDPERSNLLQMTRILQAHAFMILTDTYGDIPYFNGGKGNTELVLYPSYDAQSEIYPDILMELTEAATALDGSGEVETADVLYGGDIDQWRKYANSLILRGGMRLSKVDPTTAEQRVQQAFQAGIITDNSDNMVIRHDNNYRNETGRILNATEANNYYLAGPFVTYLQEMDDPRLRSIAVTYVDAASGPGQVLGPNGNGTSDPEVHIGMPVGNNDETARQAAAALGLDSFYEFAQADRERVVTQTTPMFMVTAAQNHLLLAEAASRGWVTGSAEELFHAGIRLHMEQMAAYDNDSVVPEEEIVAYIASNPLNDATALQQINDQYWVASFLNGPEAFANFRRSGFPNLDPNPFPGQDLINEEFIRRYTYPSSEIIVNTENVNAAIDRMGADILDTRVWWDVAQ
ncbi:SusD/RagB family nutrient-binding outer membrane lipoprotein [Tunicatimonas pelagia]|uniref:SusD/RagB family nutrient-binding outer membrane lipoprotein n=1 Tax=Tunicatimonas pelagia TaxID=931531 RepID=UPI002665EFD5|nr:SusD/RagB family nutrient-binding outer membrane lipoprotein [Tunicatimonas pelagia]WKN43165.1 SusD/RagB family nutrient-binding outer membrane lipoprotein [Tunicatimonas pelagia]